MKKPCLQNGTRTSECRGNNLLLLADELSPFISPDFSAPRMGLSVEKKLAITLHYLKDTGSVTVTANAFGVSRSTVSYLGPKYLKIPTGNSLKCRSRLERTGQLRFGKKLPFIFCG